MRFALASIEGDIRAIASMASLVLALLAFFTNLRLSAYKEYAKSVESLSVQSFLGAVPDLVLALFTGFAVLAMAPLCFEAFDLDELGSRSGALSAMFALIWLGFVALLLFQLGLAAARVVKGVKAGQGSRKA